MKDRLESLTVEGQELHFPVLDDQYVLMKKIGRGATCKVYLAKVRNSDDIVAVKVLNNSLTSNPKYYKQEIEMLQNVRHPNIINLIEGSRGVIKKHDGRTRIVDYISLEYASNGEVFDYLYFPKTGFGEKMARYVYTHLINGLEACHKNGVSHRDLKAENLMFNHEWILKIADFGYATLLAGNNDSGLLTTFLGTLSYAAPEILAKKPYYGACADIFSTGVILYTMVTGKLPFGKAVAFDSYYKNIAQCDYETFWNLMSLKIPVVTNEFKSLINLLLAYDPVQRPTILEIKNHPWMTMEMPSKEEIAKELERRKAIVAEIKEIELKQEEKKKKLRQGNTVGKYRAGGEEIVCEIFANPVTCPQYEETGNPFKVKLQGKDATVVLNNLAKYFDNEDKREKKIEACEERAKFTVVYEFDKEILEGCPDLVVENLEIEVALLEIEKEKYIAEFRKLKGDKCEFYDIYDEFILYNESKSETQMPVI